MGCSSSKESASVAPAPRAARGNRAKAAEARAAQAEAALAEERKAAQMKADERDAELTAMTRRAEAAEAPNRGLAPPSGAGRGAGVGDPPVGRTRLGGGPGRTPKGPGGWGRGPLGVREPSLVELNPVGKKNFQQPYLVLPEVYDSRATEGGGASLTQ